MGWSLTAHVVVGFLPIAFVAYVYGVAYGLRNDSNGQSSVASATGIPGFFLLVAPAYYFALAAESRGDGTPHQLAAFVLPAAAIAMEVTSVFVAKSAQGYFFYKYEVTYVDGISTLDTVRAYSAEFSDAVAFQFPNTSGPYLKFSTSRTWTDCSDDCNYRTNVAAPFYDGVTVTEADVANKTDPDTWAWVVENQPFLSGWGGWGMLPNPIDVSNYQQTVILASEKHNLTITAAPLLLRNKDPYARLKSYRDALILRSIVLLTFLSVWTLTVYCPIVFYVAGCCCASLCEWLASSAKPKSSPAPRSVSQTSANPVAAGRGQDMGGRGFAGGGGGGGGSGGDDVEISTFSGGGFD